jgi:hypothetical protein
MKGLIVALGAYPLGLKPPDVPLARGVVADPPFCSTTYRNAFSNASGTTLSASCNPAETVSFLTDLIRRGPNAALPGSLLSRGQLPTGLRSHLAHGFRTNLGATQLLQGLGGLWQRASKQEGRQRWSQAG